MRGHITTSFENASRSIIGGIDAVFTYVYMISDRRPEISPIVVTTRHSASNHDHFDFVVTHAQGEMRAQIL